jgi:N-acetylmuramoyl-L-alanine amidase
VSWHKHIGAVILAALAVGILLAGVALAQNEKVIYDRARADYFWLQSHDTAKGVYSNWKSLADRFSRIFASHPQGPFAPGSLFWMAKIYQGAYKQFNNDLDYREAIDACKRLKGHFPKSRLADDAQMIIAELHEGRGELQQAFLAYLKVTTDYPRGDMNKEAKKRLDRLERDLSPRSKASKPAKTSGKGKYANLDPGLAAVTDLRHWSTKTYTRVVMSLERPVPYKTNLLKRDKDAGKPQAAVPGSQRCAANRQGLRESHHRRRPFASGPGRAVPQRTRCAWCWTSTNWLSYKVFTLDNPFRVVIDCFGQALGQARQARVKRPH